MREKKDKLKSFTVGARLGIEVVTSIKSGSYEDAVAQARKLRADAFVDIPSGCWMDGDIDKITFICED